MQTGPDANRVAHPGLFHTCMRGMTLCALAGNIGDGGFSVGVNDIEPVRHARKNPELKYARFEIVSNRFDTEVGPYKGVYHGQVRSTGH